MNEWSRNEVITLIGLLVAVVACVAAVLVVPEFRRVVGLGRFLTEKDLLILTPKNKEEIPIIWNEHKPIVRPITGEVTGFRSRDIEKLGLYVEILIKTDQWYPQGSTPVESNGKWRLKEAHFGGTVHIVRAVLRDKYSHEHKLTEIEVSIV